MGWTLFLELPADGKFTRNPPLCGSLDRKITLLWIECSEGALRGPLDRNVLLKTYPDMLRGTCGLERVDSKVNSPDSWPTVTGSTPVVGTAPDAAWRACPGSTESDGSISIHCLNDTGTEWLPTSCAKNLMTWTDPNCSFDHWTSSNVARTCSIALRFNC
jgi:hypothetical protein